MDNIERVAQFLDGQMTPEESSQFLQDMERDPELKEAFDIQFQLISTLKQQKNDAIKEELLAYANQQEKQSNWSHYGIAASIILLIGIALWQLTTPNENLFEIHYKPYPNIVPTRGVVNNKSDAFEKYTQGQYQQAITLFKLEKFQNDTSQFYLGISYIEVNDLQSAEETLINIPKTSVFHPQSMWYLGLVQLKQEAHEQAIQTFSNILEKDYKYEEAQEIISELD